MSFRRKASFTIAGLAVAATVWFAYPYIVSTAVVLDLAGVGGTWRRMLPVRTHALEMHDLDVPTRHGAIRARVYRPIDRADRSLLVFPGIHAGGLDEPRLVALSRRLAATGQIVVTMPLPDLRVYTLTPRSTDMIEDAAVWMAAQPDLAPRHRIGLVGVSFAGGLALVAAGRPTVDAVVDRVVSFGGHGDLPRAMAYLCSGRLPDGSFRKPHDYGLAVMLLNGVAYLVPPDRVAPTRAAVLAFLDAASYAQTDPPRAATLLAKARSLAGAEPEPGRTLLHWVDARDSAEVGRALQPFLEAIGGNPVLSPERSPATHAPVFLLHGATDNVIPSFETPAVAAYLRARGNTRVDALLTPLITHADVATHIGVGDAWRLIAFWTRMNSSIGNR